MAVLPRGIQLVKWSNKDGSTTTKYRVRITRKAFTGKRNNYFDELKEALAFLQLSKLEKGQELIYSISEQERIANKLNLKAENEKNYTFGYFAESYLLNYVLQNGNNEIDKSDRPELIKRKISSKRSFIKTILNTSIPWRNITYAERQELAIPDEQEIVYRFFSEFDIREITKIDLNNYIQERLKVIKPVSVTRELTMISNVFRKLEYMTDEPSIRDLDNPVRYIDKDLLKNSLNIRNTTLSRDLQDKFYQVIDNYSNPQLAQITRLSILTGMRRSEIVYLKTTDISKDFRTIHLKHTKSGKPRTIYLDSVAQEFIQNLKPADKASDDRYFTYSAVGFGKQFSKLMNGDDELKHLHFHDLRRTYISEKVSLTNGSDSEMSLIGKLLGISSFSKFKEYHGQKDSKDIFNQIGHTARISHQHYVNPVTDEIKTFDRIKELKQKKEQGLLSDAEQQQLLNLLLSLTDE